MDAAQRLSAGAEIHKSWLARAVSAMHAEGNWRVDDFMHEDPSRYRIETWPRQEQARVPARSHITI